MIRKRDTRIPRKPLLWLAAALLFTLPPFFQGLSTWVPLALLVAVVAKFWMEPRGYRLRSVPLKLLLVAMGLAGIFFSYGDIKGIEPGVSLIIVLMTLKIMEAHTPREFHFMVMLGLVLALCGLFLVQDLLASAGVLVALTLLLTATVQFYRRSSPGTNWAPLRSAALLVVQALPIVILLFLFFPRVTSGFRLVPQGSIATTGFTDHLSPGTVSGLANSNAVAFRAEFPDGKIPRPNELYWRGVVMWQGGGLEWRAPSAPPRSPRASQGLRPNESIRQWITIEPNNAHWMFALDRPANAPPGALLAPGNYLWSWQTIGKPRRYEVLSSLRLDQAELPPREQKLAIELHGTISTAVRELARSWATADAQPNAIVRRGLEFFRDQGFRYSLDPGDSRTTTLDEFLLRRRTGFCEHYAGSFATLMRLAGIPARVVVGYLGGEWNAMGGFFVVHQSDAHAWCEVWLPENGWTRVDPTSVVAPDRINLGMAALLDQGARADTSTANLVRTVVRQPVFARIRATWQAVNYSWDTHVLSFDSDAQETLVRRIGLPSAGPGILLLCSGAMVLFVVIALVAWMQFRARPARDAAQELYLRFCEKAARYGAIRQPNEGPLAFSRRAAKLLPNESERITRISHHYVELRYSPDPGSWIVQALAHEIKVFGSNGKVSQA